MKTLLAYKKLKRILHYNPLTGYWKWKINIGRIKKGTFAGSFNKENGYIYITIDYVPYLASRLAFLYMKGYLPEYQAEHRDRNKINNKWDNLREATRQCNQRNRNVMKNNKTGVTGVCYCKNHKKFKAYIKITLKLINLGYFKNKIEAVKARWEAEKKYNWSNCCTTSSAYLYLKNKGVLCEH